MKGRVFPSEACGFTDPKTGTHIRRVTSARAIHHHPFYYLPAYDDGMHRLYFVSHRSGGPQIFAEERESGKLVQLTARDDLNEWSVHPSHDGRHVYFTAAAGLWRLCCDSLKEEELAQFGGAELKEKGMVGAAMGPTTLSRDDRWWAVPVKVGERSRFIVVDTVGGGYETILERDTIGHPQFHPDDAELLRYAGPYHDRLWVVRRDGSENRLVYRRDAARKEWIVHETWSPGRRELLTANWPHGVIGVDIDTGSVRSVASFNAWHPMVNRDGSLMVADTKRPDIGLQLFDPRRECDPPRTLCHPEASSAGKHWDTDHCPYDDGPVEVYAPQHTHPHPSFSPDGSLVVYTSDRDGFAQVYEVSLKP